MKLYNQNNYPTVPCNCPGGADMRKAAKITCELGGMRCVTTSDDNKHINHLKCCGIGGGK